MAVTMGLVLGGSMEPERIVPLALLAERVGFEEMWLTEDYFFTGAISAAASVLQATDKVTAGYGIVSALVRHPAALAMELATTDRMYPGRLRAGVGLGLPAWLSQMGLHPDSMQGAIRECVAALRALLAGEVYTDAGRHFRFDQVQLAHPPGQPVPIDLGVAGPRLVELAGEIADGLVVGLNASTDYVTWARARLAVGAERVGRPLDHRITCFSIFSVDRDSARAKAAVRDLVGLYLALGGRSPFNDALGISDQVVDLMERGGVEAVQRDMPDDWIDRVAIAGDPDECAERIRQYAAAGCHSVVLSPQPASAAPTIISLAAAEVFGQIT